MSIKSLGWDVLIGFGAIDKLNSLDLSFSNCCCLQKANPPKYSNNRQQEEHTYTYIE